MFSAWRAPPQLPPRNYKSVETQFTAMTHAPRKEIHYTFAKTRKILQSQNQREAGYDGNDKKGGLRGAVAGCEMLGLPNSRGNKKKKLGPQFGKKQNKSAIRVRHVTVQERCAGRKLKRNEGGQRPRNQATSEALRLRNRPILRVNTASPLTIQIPRKKTEFQVPNFPSEILLPGQPARPPAH